jgi:hypothetical protein
MQGQQGKGGKGCKGNAFHQGRTFIRVQVNSAQSRTKGQARKSILQKRTGPCYIRVKRISEVIMDPINLGFYALICGTLSAAGPRMGGFISRFGIGVIVGAIAAWGLPLLRGTIGY